MGDRLGEGGEEGQARLPKTHTKNRWLRAFKPSLFKRDLIRLCLTNLRGLNKNPKSTNLIECLLRRKL
jgi:hypothetical protein